MPLDDLPLTDRIRFQLYKTPTPRRVREPDKCLRGSPQTRLESVHSSPAEKNLKDSRLLSPRNRPLGNDEALTGKKWQLNNEEQRRPKWKAKSLKE